MNSYDVTILCSSQKTEHWVPFWVGLMDGDGSFQVNHWRKKSLQFRCVIKLKNTAANLEMLQHLVFVLKIGRVRLVKKADQVVWVEDHRDKIQELIVWINIYPPLSSRIICQLAFVQEFLEKKGTPVSTQVPTYLDQRSFKYQNQQAIILKINPQYVVSCTYFPSWLSGFIEAEGCFSQTSPKNLARKPVFKFSISQKNDFYLLEAIKIYLKAQNKIREVTPDFFVLEIYKQSIIEWLSQHFSIYPLRGEKKKSGCFFYEKFQQYISVKSF